MQHVPNVGKIIKGGEDARRDAIHVAVAPVRAGEDLEPGERVALIFGGTAIGVGEADAADAVGVVDPYLTETVEAGQRFWLFLFPCSITKQTHEHAEQV